MMKAEVTVCLCLEGYFFIFLTQHCKACLLKGRCCRQRDSSLLLLFLRVRSHMGRSEGAVSAEFTDPHEEEYLLNVFGAGLSTLFHSGGIQR